MNFFERIRYKKNMRKIKNSILTPKGECLSEYCRNIKENEWTSHDNIEAYEEEIACLRDILEQEKFVFTREEVATYMYEALSIPMEE